MIVEATNANILAYLALLLYPVVAVVFFRKYRPSLATGFTVMAGIMFLPEVVVLLDLPVLPDFDKQVIVGLSLFLAVVVTHRSRLRIRSFGPGFWAFVVLASVSAVGTTLMNPNTLYFGPTVLPPISYYDALTQVIRDLILVGIPFFIARIMYRDEHDLRDLLVLLAGGVVIYAIPILIEWRLSPQMHGWTYGFGQHSFEQTRRGGGWRPMVYMAHGLALAMFVVVGLLAAAGLSRIGVRFMKLSARTWTGILAMILVMANSLGALIYGVFFTPIVLFTRKWIGRTAIILASIAFFFPFLRAGDLFPTEYLVEKAKGLNEERASSLEFRFANEDALIKRAQEQWLFGWGAYGRSKIFDEDGRDISVTDGEWIIQLGVRGVVGFSFRFGLLFLPVVIAFRRLKRISDPDVQMMLATLTLITAVSAVELLPNGLFSFLPYFYAGALYGLAPELTRVRQPARSEAPPDKPRPRRRRPRSRWDPRPVAEPTVGRGGSHG